MKRIKVRLSIGFPTAVRKDVIEVEDDATEDDIYDAAEEWAQNYIDVGWEEE
jgi:hypothetical protein